MESLAQDCLEALARHIAVPDAHHAVARGFEERSAGGVVGQLVGPVVCVTLQVQHQALRDAVEVHDEAAQDVLAPKLQPEHPAIPQQRPRVALGRGRRSAQLTREDEFLRGFNVPEWIHRSNMSAAAPPPGTKTARAGA